MNQYPSRDAAAPSEGRIALGTAQFGLAYGVSNRAGQPSLETAGRILALARERGCDTLDTAIAYGESESRLGSVGVAGWQVVSKLPAFPEGTPDLRAWARLAVEGSLRRLGVPHLHALLLHAPAQLNTGRGDELFAALTALKDEGWVGRIGASIYAPSELEPLMQHPIELVQAPFNVLDRGLATSGWADRLASRGVEIHLRSIFLQGLLLMNDAQRPTYFDTWSPLWRDWHTWLRQTGMTPLQACVRFALSQPFAAKVVVGVAAERELEEILDACGGELPAVPDSLRCDDPGLINPSTWKIQ